MLHSWTLGGFKSVRDSQTLNLKKLTLLAGANSSGKSSLLQSILVLAQTINSKVSERHLILNGEYVKLGTFGDVLNHDVEAKRIHVGFTFDSALQAQMGIPRSNLARKYDINVEFSAATPATSSVAKHPVALTCVTSRGVFLTHVGSPSASYLQHGVTLTLRSPSNLRRAKKRYLDQTKARLNAINPSGDPLTLSAAQAPPDSWFAYASKRDVSDDPYLYNVSTSQIVGFELEHFVPRAIVRKKKLYEELLNEVLQTLRRSSMNQIPSQLERWRTVESDYIRNVVAAAVANALQIEGSAARSVQRLRTNHPRLLEELKKELAISEVSTLEVLRETQDESLGILLRELKQFFSNVRYIGPLREEPKPVYGIGSSADPLDVGPKGQYTASVLHLFAGQHFDSVTPDASPHASQSLDDMVGLWLSYFEVADSVTTSDEGKLGHRLDVLPSGTLKAVDLTNVGVGLSQVLPVLVMGLVAPRDALLLFEQPELHLHPAVQSLLADFFLALNRAGKQCIVETHSEYLINRLRLRIAESQSSLEKDICLLYAERVEGATKFEEINVNRFGAIPHWPAGFFDQGPNESERIMRAAKDKRSREATLDSAT